MKLPSDQDESGRSLGEEEISLVTEAIQSGTLTSTKGKFVKQLESQFAQLMGTRFAHACASGTSAIHAAVAAIDPEPGDEIITSAITDMGALAPLLYQGAIPVFADVEPDTGNLTAETVEARLSERTRAVIVTHLFGRPCAMAGILDLARRHGLPVIEDCAQAYLARDGGALVGTMGSLGCFSLQQGKHITCGEGGLVVTDDADLARRVDLFINKGWGYGDRNPDHSFLALNCRMSELQGAVAVAQMSKLPALVGKRIEMAERLTEHLQGIPGVRHVGARPGSVATYWRYCLQIDERVIPGGPSRMAAALREKGIASGPRYIQKPAFQCEVFRKQRTFGCSRYPFTLARPQALDYDPASFPGTFALLDSILVLPWNERIREENVRDLAGAIRWAARVATEESR